MQAKSEQKKKQEKFEAKLKPGCKVISFPGNQTQVVLTPKLLGSGQYGQVHQAFIKDDPESLYAVKVIDRKKIKGRTQELLVNEIQIMTEIQNPCVLSLIAATKTLSNYYLVLEYCNGGDLEGFIQKRGGYLQESEARLVLRQIVNGLKAIHDQQYMHRDMKLPNILLHFPNLTKEEME